MSASQMKSDTRTLVRSTGVLASATAVSRILGFVRDLLLAKLFGTTAAAQAFVVAFRLPNLLRDLVAEGAVTSAFVPVLSSYRARGDMTSFWALSRALLTRLSVVLILLGAAGVFAAPLIVRLIAPGFVGEPEKFALTVRLTRILFPFIALVGLWAYFMGLLNSLRHFAMPALGPAILNLSMIIACVWFAPGTGVGVVAVAIAVIVGGIIQLLIQLPVAHRMGFRWGWRWQHEGSSGLLRLLGPRMLGSAVYQLDVLIDTILASMGWIVGQGAVAALYFANRLVQLPMALFGTASAQASLPSLSEQAARGDFAAFRATLHRVLRLMGFLLLPASVGLMILAFPIIGGLFERGAFTHQATIMTAQALICYATGLMAYSISKVMTGAFYALKDTWTPVKLAAEAVAVNTVLSLLLMWPLKVNGLVLAAVLSNTLNAYRLTHLLERRLQTSLVAPVMEPLLRMSAASLLMGAGGWGLWQVWGATVSAWLGLSGVIGASLFLYITSCRLLGVQELSTALRWLSQVPLLRRFASA